jgi:predicted transcriptional regulator
MVVYYSPSDTIVLRAIVPGIWDESSKKRSRSQIYVEILELLKRGPMTPFEIAFYARLNHKRTKEYVRLLERSGYLESNEEDGRTFWTLSASGKVIVDKVRAILGKEGISKALPTAQQPLWTVES